MKGIGVLILLLMFSLSLEGCYTVVYTDVVYQDNYYPPPPPPPRPPHPHPPYYPPQPIIIVPTPVNPPPQDYKTRTPESGNDRKRDDGVVGLIRDKGGRGNDGGRR